VVQLRDVRAGKTAMLGAVVATLVAGGLALAVAPAADAGVVAPYEVIATIPLSGGGNAVALDPGTHTAYVVDSATNSVTAIDTSTDAAVATIPVGIAPFAIAVDPGTHRAYVSNTGVNDFDNSPPTSTDDTVSVIDTTTNTVINTITVFASPRGVAVDPGTHAVYVAIYLSNQMAARIDPTTNPATVTTSDILGSRPWAAAIDPSTHLAYVTTLFGGTVSVLDGTTITDTIGQFNGPTQIAVEAGIGAAPGHAYVVSAGGVSVINTVTNTVTGQLPTGNAPSSVSIDPGTHLAYVTNSGDDTVSVINTSDDTAIATVPVGSGPGSAAVDPSTHRVYVLNSNSISVIAPHQDPTITATVSSAHARTSHGWYRTPVTVTFHCTTHSAALTKACPAAVILRSNGAGQSITRTIAAVDDGTATVTVRGINIDESAPSVFVGRIRNGATYRAATPTATCVGKDALSGIASCTLTRRTSGHRTTITATATDKAGNTRRAQASYTTLPIYVQGAAFTGGAFSVHAGHTYTFVVTGSTRRPTYYDAAVYPMKPAGHDYSFHAAGQHRWTLRVTMTKNLASHTYWNAGVKIGSTMHVVKLRVS
jgi:YVTN family beta-propeller protein